MSLTEAAGKIRLEEFAKLLEKSGIDLGDVASVKRMNVWEGFLKDNDGNAQKVVQHGLELVPKWAEGPEWPVIQPGPSVKLPTLQTKPKSDAGWKNAVVLPDMQIGYWRDRDGELQPTHDEAAIELALAITKAAKPSLVAMVGDNLDLPEFGKYRLTPAFQQTTQPAIDRATLLCAQARAAAPGADIIWLAGNHEERMPNYILDNAKVAFGLRQGNAAPEGWPVLSVPYLCRMDEQGIEYEPGYPASHVWITPRLRVIHGDLVRNNASTAAAYLGREKTSVIFGHTHRREYAARTREDHDGPKEVMAASPGCLARTDGAVPSTKQGTDLDGRPLKRQEDWQQGIAVVEFDTESGDFNYEQVAIINGQARWRGKTYAATE